MFNVLRTPWLHLIHCICNRPCATIILILSSVVLVGRVECNFLISQSWFLSRAVNKGWEPGLFLGYFELTTSYFQRIQIESNDLPCSIPSWLVAYIWQLEILLAALSKKSWPVYAIVMQVNLHTVSSHSRTYNKQKLLIELKSVGTWRKIPQFTTLIFLCLVVVWSWFTGMWQTGLF